MSHHHELTMSDEIATPPRIKASWLFGTLAAFALFVIIGAYSSRMTWDYSDYDQDRATQRYETLKKLRAAESKLINPVDDKGNPTAEWVDASKGTIRIPIEEAMVKEVQALKNRPAVIGAEIPSAAPAPAATNAAPAAPASGSTNAAPAKPSAPASTNAAPVKPAKAAKGNK
jgi:hypothetical protein